MAAKYGTVHVYSYCLRETVGANCCQAISERPTEITDDKWNEMDSNTITDLHLALADKVLSSVAKKRQ